MIKLDNRETRLDLFNHLRQNKIGVNVHYIPVHLQPYYKKFGFKEGDFPNAEDCYERIISLPLYPGISSKEIDCVIMDLTREALR